jgi:hypothetical protein
MAQLRMWKFQDSTTTAVGSYYNSGDTELFSSDTDNPTPSSTNKAKFPNYNSVSVQRYFPQKVGHTLLNGGFVTFTPNTKHRITMQFNFLTATQYEVILENYNNLVVIQPEFGTSKDHLPETFQQGSGGNEVAKEFKVLWVDDAINFTYTDTYKGAGYSGTINWLEV